MIPHGINTFAFGVVKQHVVPTCTFEAYWGLKAYKEFVHWQNYSTFQEVEEEKEEGG